MGAVTRFCYITVEGGGLLCASAQPRNHVRSHRINEIEAPKALDFQLKGLHIEPSEANLALAAILNVDK